MDASVLREWLGARVVGEKAISAPAASIADRVEAFVGRTFGAKYATRAMPQGGVLPEPTLRWLGECAALLEECCEVRDAPRRAFERLFALIERIENAELEVVAFVE
ncbi:MAG: hypothetical protein IT459_21700, partial [Planctomycetes bacterium]|nr:hypothetical protein [Planctomycetota bacterium]